jgi:hypothetical protein
LQRIEEFKLLLDMTQDDKEKKKLNDKYRAYLMETLPAIEEYASSSDEEKPYPISSISKSIEESPEGYKVHKRLPGITEKWNSDADSVNEEEENDHISDNNCDESKHDDVETNYSSDSGSQALWGDASFNGDNNAIDNNTPLEEEFSERFFGTATEIVPALKKGGVSRKNIPQVKVSSFVSINTLTGQQIDPEEDVFTATEEPEISGMHSQESYSASSQCSTGGIPTASTASTVKVTQPKQVSSSQTSSSSSSVSRSARASSSKSSYFQNPPQSTSKIITRARNGFLHEEDIGNNLDLYSIATNKKRKK